MEERLTLGEIRDLLAGARDPVLARIGLPDETPCRVSTALTEDGEGYFLAVEFNRTRRDLRP